MEISITVALLLYCFVLTGVCRGLNSRLKKIENKKPSPDFKNTIDLILETQELQKSQIKQLKNRIVTELKKR